MILEPMSTVAIDSVRAAEATSHGGDPTANRILDAALEEFVSFGLRRATLQSISRRARVGRMTLHRRFATKQALIEAIVSQEIGRIWAQVGLTFDEHDSLPDQLAEGLAYGIRRAAEHPLFSRLLGNRSGSSASVSDRGCRAPYGCRDHVRRSAYSRGFRIGGGAHCRPSR